MAFRLLGTAKTMAGMMRRNYTAGSLPGKVPTSLTYKASQVFNAPPFFFAGTTHTHGCHGRRGLHPAHGAVAPAALRGQTDPAAVQKAAEGI